MLVALLFRLIRNILTWTGGLGIPGLYVPSDPGAPDSQSGKGQILLSFGKLFEKGLSLGTGQVRNGEYKALSGSLSEHSRQRLLRVYTHLRNTATSLSSIANTILFDSATSKRTTAT